MKNYIYNDSVAVMIDKYPHGYAVEAFYLDVPATEDPFYREFFTSETLARHAFENFLEA